MGRLPPTRKYRKRKTGRDPVLPPVGTGKLRIKQVRSGSGHSYRMKRTLVALGLKHHQAEVVHADHPALRGMLQQVRHLVVVTADGAERAERATKDTRRGKKSDAKS
jgi:large subunit ribosomal protein L30